MPSSSSAVVSVIAESAGYGDDDRGKLGFLVFAAAAPGSMFFLTGDSTLNPLVAQYSVEAGGMSPSFIDWFLYMSVPYAGCAAVHPVPGPFPL